MSSKRKKERKEERKKENKWRKYIFSRSSTDARSCVRTLFEKLSLLREVTCEIIYLCVI
jgi:hypothetical protein